MAVDRFSCILAMIVFTKALLATVGLLKVILRQPLASSHAVSSTM